MLIKISGKAGCGKTLVADQIKSIIFDGQKVLILEENERPSEQHLANYDHIIITSIVER